MSLHKIFLIVCLLCAPSFAQDPGRRPELEDSLQSRYRVTILGGGFMGTRGDNSIRHAGGVVVLLRDGFYGSHDRSKLPANAIQEGKPSVLTGNKEVALAKGEKFYVTAVHVGSDLVTLGLLSARMIPGANKSSQVWATANFFFPSETLTQGDIGKVSAVIDQWLVPEGGSSPPPPAPTPPSAMATAPPASGAIDLKPGMTRDQVVSALGTPLQETAFGDHRWLTYPGITITLEQDKLTSADRNAQALVPVRISSDPDGADVFLDGSFVSSTPAVLRLPAGTYKIVVKISGYTDWERETRVLPGAEVNLNAKLTK
jgi:PEGA domain-containing protein/SmpA/OmlA family protein